MVQNNNANNANANTNNASQPYTWAEGEGWRNLTLLAQHLPNAASSFTHTGDYYFCVCYDELCAYPNDPTLPAYVWVESDNTWEPLPAAAGLTWAEYKTSSAGAAEPGEYPTHELSPRPLGPRENRGPINFS